MKLVRRALDFWFEPIDPVRLDTFRRVFAATLLFYFGRWMFHGYEWLSTRGFHETAETVRPWVTPPLPAMPPALVPVFGLVALLSGGALVLGWRPRVFTWVVLACVIYGKFVDPIAAFTLNKLYVVGFLTLALAPAPRSVSGPDGRAVLRQSAWPVRVLQATLLIQYCTAGTCKIFHGDWLTHTDVLWTHAQGLYRTDVAAWMLRTLPVPAWAVMMYSALVFEVLAPVLFAWRRTRPIAFVWGFGFQTMIALTMRMLVYFSVQMLSFYILFVDVGHLHAFRATVRTGIDKLTVFLPGRVGRP